MSSVMKEDSKLQSLIGTSEILKMARLKELFEKDVSNHFIVHLLSRISSLELGMLTLASQVGNKESYDAAITYLNFLHHRFIDSMNTMHHEAIKNKEQEKI